MLQALKKIIGGLLVSIFFMGVAMAGEAEFKIAVASEGKDPTAQIDMKAARTVFPDL